tara:strand:- start:132 stop:401 length:270 start_codon:yes stop_codon:yes gene_type:complete
MFWCFQRRIYVEDSKDTRKYKNKLRIIYGNKYDLSKVNYTFKHSQIILICKKHGEFSSLPHVHLLGRGCPNCRKEKITVRVLRYYGLID